MRVFAITLVASIVPSILFWNFGLAQKVWPSHPLLMTTLIAEACGITVQTLSSRYLTPSKQKS